MTPVFSFVIAVPVLDKRSAKKTKVEIAKLHAEEVPEGYIRAYEYAKSKGIPVDDVFSSIKEGNIDAEIIHNVTYVKE